MDITAEIRAEVARQQVATSSLATQVGMTAATLARKLRGDRPVTLTEAQSLAQALGVPLSTLATRAETADHAA